MSNILRHGETAGHLKAVAAHVAAKSAKNREEPEKAFGSSPVAVGYSHVLFQRNLIKTGASFRTFAAWLKAAQLSGGDVATGAMGPTVSAQLTSVMADRERDVTAKLLQAATCCGLLQDAREDKVPVILKMVLWSWPRGLPRPNGKLPTGVESLGVHDRGPWVAHRVAAVGEGKDKAQLLVDAVAKNCNDDAAFAGCVAKVHFLATDGAFDELAAGDRVRADLPNCRFHSEDESHGALTVIKHAMEADEELRETDMLFVSGKKPYSLAKLMSTSRHFAKLVEEEQVKDGLAVLKHFGWAPQRFDSRKKPMGRAALRLRQAFGALALEAESNDAKRRAAALHLLEGLSGENSHRILLAGMLADFLHEHSQWVHSADDNDPDVCTVQQGLQRFLRRVDVLFSNGLVLASENSVSFTKDGMSCAFFH